MDMLKSFASITGSLSGTNFNIAAVRASAPAELVRGKSARSLSTFVETIGLISNFVVAKLTLGDDVGAH